MDIAGQYDDSRIKLDGTADGIRALSREIQKLVGEQLFSLLFPSTSPAPYLGTAKSLKLRRDAGNVCVSRDADVITITGSEEKLAILASNIERLAEQDSGSVSGNLKTHLHIEYYPEHFYVRWDSIPLVLTMRTTVR